jgi:lipoprotein NlpI
MLHRSIVPSPKAALSLHEVLQLTDIYLESAHRVTSNNVTLVLCHNAEVALSQVKSTSKKSSSSDPEEQATCQKMAAAYYNLGKLLENLGHQDEAETFYKKCKKLGYVADPT